MCGLKLKEVLFRDYDIEGKRCRYLNYENFNLFSKKSRYSSNKNNNFSKYFVLKGYFKTL